MKLEKEGRENRQKLKEYNDMVNAKGANKDKPQRPDDICIQVVDSNMTNAALVRLLEDAERAGNKYLFTRMDELEMLKQVGNGSIDHVTEIIRRAFDTDLYGQERVGSQSVTARTPLRWNFTVSSTQDNAVRFFGKHIANGTFSRLNVCTIVEDKTVDFPVFGKYDDHLRSRLAPYLQMLDEAKSTNPGLATSKTAILALIDLCDEYLTLKDSNSNIKTDLMYYQQQDFINKSAQQVEPTPMEKLADPKLNETQDQKPASKDKHKSDK